MAPDSAVVTEGSINSADGTKLAYRAWPLSGAKITFAVVHGLGEHSGRYERFARGMAEFQMATYAIDLRGHGKSAGQRGHVDAWSQWTDDAAALIKHAQAEASGEVVPLGHSFGGVVLLSTVLGGKAPNARRFVVSSPALKLKVKVPAWKSSLAGVLSSVAPKLAMTENVRAALTLVARGEAALGIVYATDAAAEPNAKVVGMFPADSHPPIVYPAALTAAAKPPAAQYLAFLRSAAARAVFQRYGFTYLARAEL